MPGFFTSYMWIHVAVCIAAMWSLLIHFAHVLYFKNRYEALRNEYHKVR